MALDLSGLKKAVQSLANAIRVYSAATPQSRPELERVVLRAGVIQNFEFTYE